MDHIRRVDVLSFGKGGRLFPLAQKFGQHKGVTNEYLWELSHAGVNLVTEKNLGGEIPR